mmetsp:Transcript_6077/g.11631  ORF Transcript_6077/g.11631 Transcript_6077/m.11631 type:complete len:219 (+) Transcript_6077:98-754(+)
MHRPIDNTPSCTCATLFDYRTCSSWIPWDLHCQFTELALHRVNLKCLLAPNHTARNFLQDQGAFLAFKNVTSITQVSYGSEGARLRRLLNKADSSCYLWSHGSRESLPSSSFSQILSRGLLHLPLIRLSEVLKDASSICQNHKPVSFQLVCQQSSAIVLVYDRLNTLERASRDGGESVAHPRHWHTTSTACNGYWSIRCLYAEQSANSVNLQNLQGWR